MSVPNARVLWRSRLAGAGHDGVLVDDHIVLTSHASDDISMKSYVEGFTLDGRRHWQREFDCLAVRRAGSAVVVDGARLRRLDPRTGEVTVERQFAGETRLLPTSALGPVVQIEPPRAGLLPGLVVVDPNTLDTLWSAADPMHSVVHDAVVCRYRAERVEVTNLQDGRSRAVDVDLPPGWHVHSEHLWCHFAATQRYGVDLVAGSVRWHHEGEQERPWHVNRSAVTLQDRVFVCSTPGVCCFDLQTGERVWTLDAWHNGSYWSHGAPGRLYVTQDVLWCVTSGGILRLKRDDGSILGYFSLGREATFALPLSDTRIVVRLSDALHCIAFN